MGQLGREWCVGTWGGPRSHGYHYCPEFYVNTGLGQQGLIEERSGGGGQGKVSGMHVFLSFRLWFHPGVIVPQKPFSTAGNGVDISPVNIFV